MKGRAKSARSWVCAPRDAGIENNTRRFNIREGLTAAEDHLPKRFTSEVLPETKKGITREQMSILLREYYAARNWDENGVPKSEDGIQ